MVCRINVGPIWLGSGRAKAQMGFGQIGCRNPQTRPANAHDAGDGAHDGGSGARGSGLDGAERA